MDTEESETRVHVNGQKKIEMDFFFGWESREINLRHTFLFKGDHSFIIIYETHK